MDESELLLPEEQEVINQQPTPKNINSDQIVEIPTEATNKEGLHQDSLLEARSLASFIRDGISGLGQEKSAQALENYFDKKQKSDSLFKFEDPAKLAQEILSIEARVSKISTPDSHPEFAQSIRESLISTILSGKVGAEAISSRLNGTIAISERPGQEVGDYQNPENLAAFFKVENGQSQVYMYESSFKENPNHHFQHEMGHLFAETGAIWDREIFANFLDAVSTMDEVKIREMEQQAPELAGIFSLIQKPEDALFFRPYIKGKLTGLSQLQGTALSEGRKTVAKEIIAEMTAFYLGSDNNELSYFNARLEMAGKDLPQLAESLGISSQYEAFLQKNDPEGKGLTVEQAYEFIKSVPAFQTEFHAQKSFLDKMNQAFTNRGKDIKPINNTLPADTSIEYYDGAFDDYSVTAPSSSHEATSHNHAGGENPFTAIWDFITGTKKPSPIKPPLK